MKAHKIETVLTEDGTIMLQGLPFHAGDAVEVIVLKAQTSPQEQVPKPEPGKDLYPLRHTVIRYDAPTEPVALEDWEALK